MVGGGLGTVLLAIAYLYLGGDPAVLMDSGVGASAPRGSQAGASGELEDEQAQFAAAVLGSTEDVWTELFAESGRTYDLPKLVLFDEAVRSACGMQDAAVGPFYCPPDGTVYLDLGFFRDLSRRHGAPGDFARAYVIAHEVGHHVQDLLGTAGSVRASQASAGDSRANQLSVRLELQADFFAGVWAHHASSSGVLEECDLEEALRAASQIGDDRLQMESQGYVAPDSFTHGTAEQRARWFLRGFRSGDPNAGDTFSGEDL
jgi:predicted metalloprotease